MRAQIFAPMLALMLVPLLAQTPAQPAATAPAPVELTGEQDHQRLLDLLHIKALRPPVTQAAGSANPVNFDESKPIPGVTCPTR